MALLVVKAPEAAPAAQSEPNPNVVPLGPARRQRRRNDPSHAAVLTKKLRARMLREMNRDHALVLLDEEIPLLHILRNADGTVRHLSFRSEADLDRLYRARPLCYATYPERGGVEWKRASRVKAWLADRSRRLIREVVNCPQPWGADPLPPDVLNVWMGYGISPAPADTPRVGGTGYNAAWPAACRLTLEHILDVWCGNDLHLFRWVIAWMAQLVQQPDRLPGSYILVRGGQGAGKGIVIQGVLGRILGKGFLQIADKRYLVSNFNGILQGKTLIFADELFVRDPEAANALKNKVSEPKIVIERKGKEPFEIANTSRIIMATNAEHAIAAEKDERRPCVLDAGDHRVIPRGAPLDHPNARYFADLAREVEGDGPAAFFRFLLEVDYAAVNLRIPPTTKALATQKLLSLPPLAAWWYERLCDGVLVGKDDNKAHDGEPDGRMVNPPWPLEVTKPIIYASVDAFAERQRLSEYKRPTYNQVSGFLTDPKGPVRLSRTGGREGTGNRDYTYLLPDLEAARIAFADWLAVPYTMLDWGHVEADNGGCNDMPEEDEDQPEPDAARVPRPRQPPNTPDAQDAEIPF